MEERKIVIQKLQKSLDDEYAVAEKYYDVLSVINNLGLTKREIELVAYTAINDTISYANKKAEFCKKYNTTSATISNLICRLKKMGVFVKESGKIKVNPVIVIDFKKNLNLVINITHNDKVKQDVVKGVDNKKNVNEVSGVRKSDKSGNNTSI
jgi:hypothetical protein